MSRRVFVLAAISFCLLLAALATRTGSLALMAVPFLTYVGAGLLASRSVGRMVLTAERSLDITRADEVATVNNLIVVRNAGPGAGIILIHDLLQPGAIRAEGDPQRLDSLEPGKETQLGYAFRAERGVFKWETVPVTISDPFGLFPQAHELPGGAEVVVRPLVKKLRPFPLRPNGTFHSPGLVPARMGGSGTDFWGVREYRPGDPLRRLDWRRNARHPRQLFTMEFEQEEIADVGLILDARRRNDFQIKDDSLFEHSLDATSSLAEVFLRQGNRVGLIVVGDVVRAVRPGFAKVQLHRILRTLAAQRPGEGGSVFALETLSLRLFAPRALIIVLSPLESDEWQVFARLRARGDQGLLISPDPIDFMASTVPHDQAGRLALRLARVERRLRLRRVARLGVQVIPWRVSKPLTPLIRNALRAMRRVRT